MIPTERLSVWLQRIANDPEKVEGIAQEIDRAQREIADEHGSNDEEHDALVSLLDYLTPSDYTNPYWDAYGSPVVPDYERDPLNPGGTT